MRRIGLTLAALAATALLATSASAGGKGFDGLWVGTDVGDGSTMYVTIAGGKTKSIALYDEAGSVCGGAPIIVYGSGTLSSDGATLTSSLYFRCLNNPASRIGPATIHFFNHSDGTISDDGTGAVSFHRL